MPYVGNPRIQLGECAKTLDHLCKLGLRHAQGMVATASTLRSS
jgi:hypothetical protein